MAASSYKSFLMDQMDARARYFLMTATIVPRPIAFVTSWDRQRKVLNAAPFSFFNGISSDPPLIILGLAGKPAAEGVGWELKDTARNILETGEFVINICDVGMAALVEGASAPLPPEQSEVEALGLETIQSEVVGPPRLAVSPVHFECRLFESVQLPRARNQLVVGEILRVHVRESVMNGSRVNVDALDPLARLAAGQYGALGRTFKVT